MTFKPGLNNPARIDDCYQKQHLSGNLWMFFSNVMRRCVISLKVLSGQCFLAFNYILYIVIEWGRLVNGCGSPPWRRLDWFIFNIRRWSSWTWLKGLSDVLLNLSSEKGCEFLKALMGDRIRVKIRISNWRIKMVGTARAICFRRMGSRLMSASLGVSFWRHGFQFEFKMSITLPHIRHQTVLGET